MERGTAGAASRILLVEDDVTLGRIVVRAHTGAGFDTTFAATGSRGLALALQFGFALVVLDVGLPDLDGFEFMARLAHAHAAQKVMIVSALSDVRSKLRCFELGACDYVTKPFAVAELVARVQVRSSAQPELRSAERFLDADGFRLDLNKRRIVSGAGTIPLSTREFALLEHLMRRSGAVCSRDELLEAVWGYSFNAITNVLEVYIAKLRHKLGADCIQTVRGRGYSFSGA